MAIITFQPKGSTPPASKPSSVLGLPTNKQFFLWAISGLTLIALADPLPQLAVSFTLLLILGVLLINSDSYIGLLNAGLTSGGAVQAPGGGVHQGWVQ